MSVVRAVRRANRPGPPEDSVVLRAAATGAVAVGIVACAYENELSPWFAVVAIVIVGAGNLFSYRRRRRPLPYVKLLLAAAMLGAFAWFFVTVSADASAGALGSVEGPLAALFTVMQAAHAFDVPSRRDLGFSLAGSATLMAVAAAEAVSLAFGSLVVLWAACAITGLLATWGSMAGGSQLRLRSAVLASAASVLVGALVLAVVPAPRPASGLVGPSGLATGTSTAQPSHLVPAGAADRARPASASGPTGVGGFLGFAGPLDTAVRASLGNQVVLRVRADRPTFWIAETFDQWAGQSWSEALPTGGRWQVLTDGPPFAVPPGAAVGGAGPGGSDGRLGAGAPLGLAGPVGPGIGVSGPDYQTFYLATSGSDLVLHADRAAAVWFPAHRVYVSPDGTIRGSASLGAGSIYTVLSTVNVPTPAELSADRLPLDLTSSTQRADLQLPHLYPRVRSLAERVTAHHSSLYAKVTALESWIGSHTTYTTDIPPLRPGQDTVDQFLFGSRRGYCEQISTSLAVMLRSLGIPAREATGYVPGPYDPLTDLYEVEAKDAHAWVQVWFPGYGWVSFDPTAFVPAANPSPSAAIGHVLWAAAKAIPVVPVVPLVALLLAFAAAWWRRRRRPASWRAAVTRDLERAAVRAAVPVEPGDTLHALAGRLDAACAGRLPVVASDVARAAEAAAWSGVDPPPGAIRALTVGSRQIRRRARPPGWRAVPARWRAPARGGRRPAGAVRSARGARVPRPSSPRRPGAGGRPSAGGDG